MVQVPQGGQGGRRAGRPGAGRRSGHRGGAALGAARLAGPLPHVRPRPQAGRVAGGRRGVRGRAVLPDQPGRSVEPGDAVRPAGGCTRAVKNPFCVLPQCACGVGRVFMQTEEWRASAAVGLVRQAARCAGASAWATWRRWRPRSCWRAPRALRSAAQSSRCPRRCSGPAERVLGGALVLKKCLGGCVTQLGCCAGACKDNRLGKRARVRCAPGAGRVADRAGNE